MKRVGIIGLGLVGGALAERLLEQGWSVGGFDLDASKNAALAERGGHAEESAQALVAGTDIILLSLPTSEIASRLLDDLASSLRGKTVLDTTTGDPETMAACGQRLATLGCDYLDATIAGSSSQVRRGEALVMLGGSVDAVTRVVPLLNAFCRQYFHLGGWGAGARMKLVVNLVLGLNRAVLAEGLAFARALGVDPRRALEVLQQSPACSRVMETKGERMLTGNFAPEARLAQHAKDVRLILQSAAAGGLNLPLSTLHSQLLARLMEEGYGELDNSAIIKMFERPPPPSHETT